MDHHPIWKVDAKPIPMNRLTVTSPLFDFKRSSVTCSCHSTQVQYRGYGFATTKRRRKMKRSSKEDSSLADNTFLFILCTSLPVIGRKPRECCHSNTPEIYLRISSSPRKEEKIRIAKGERRMEIGAR